MRVPLPPADQARFRDFRVCRLQRLACEADVSDPALYPDASGRVCLWVEVTEDGETRVRPYPISDTALCNLVADGAEEIRKRMGVRMMG